MLVGLGLGLGFFWEELSGLGLVCLTNGWNVDFGFREYFQKLKLICFGLSPIFEIVDSLGWDHFKLFVACWFLIQSVGWFFRFLFEMISNRTLDWVGVLGLWLSDLHAIHISNFVDKNIFFHQLTITIATISLKCKEQEKHTRLETNVFTKKKLLKIRKLCNYIFQDNELNSSPKCWTFMALYGPQG